MEYTVTLEVDKKNPLLLNKRVPSSFFEQNRIPVKLPEENLEYPLLLTNDRGSILAIVDIRDQEKPVAIFGSEYSKNQHSDFLKNSENYFFVSQNKYEETELAKKYHDVYRSPTRKFKRKKKGKFADLLSKIEESSFIEKRRKIMEEKKKKRKQPTYFFKKKPEEESIFNKFSTLVSTSENIVGDLKKKTTKSTLNLDLRRLFSSLGGLIFIWLLEEWIKKEVLDSQKFLTKLKPFYPKDFSNTGEIQKTLTGVNSVFLDIMEEEEEEAEGEEFTLAKFPPNNTTARKHTQDGMDIDNEVIEVNMNGTMAKKGEYDDDSGSSSSSSDDDDDDEIMKDDNF
jgi:hypothetical protein